MYEHLLLKPEPERFSNQMVSDGMQLVGEPITEFFRRKFGHAMARFGMIFVALGEQFAAPKLVVGFSWDRSDDRR